MLHRCSLDTFDSNTEMPVLDLLHSLKKTEFPHLGCQYRKSCSQKFHRMHFRSSLCGCNEYASSPTCNVLLDSPRWKVPINEIFAIGEIQVCKSNPVNTEVEGR